jgi:hypothetical protein
MGSRTRVTAGRWMCQPGIPRVLGVGGRRLAAFGSVFVVGVCLLGGVSAGPARAARAGRVSDHSTVGIGAPVGSGSHRSGWGSLAVAARGPVSSGFGRLRPVYRVRRVHGGLVAVSRSQRLRAWFGSGGVRVASGGVSFGLRLSGVGDGGRVRRLGSAVPIARGNRAVYSHGGGVSEWYANGPLGIEQGFTVAHSQAAGGGPLTLAMVLGGGLRASLSGGGQGVSLDGRGVALAYRDLVASDARGRTLRSWFELHGGRLEIRVDDRAAVFPVRIDPLIEQAKLTAADGAADDEFGYSVGVTSDGSTVVAGAPYATVSGHAAQGAVYVFAKPAGGWADGTQTTKLTAADGAANDNLGWSVGISSDGSTVVAGAPSAATVVSGHAAQGAVYVFAKPAGGWADGTQTAKLTGAVSDVFGYSVGVSSDGSTVVAGAPGATVSGHATQGAVYVFAKPAGGWADGTQTGKLTAADGAAHDELGYSVGVSSDGSTVTAGAPQGIVSGHAVQGAVYVFAKPAGGWADGTQAGKLTAADGAGSDALGSSVGVSSDGSTVVAGAPDARTVVSGQTAQGAVYVFAKPAGGWADGTQTGKLTAADGGGFDDFGYSVGVSSDGSTVAAGANTAAVSGNGSQGAVYVFAKPAGGWADGTQTGKLTAADGAAHDNLGWSVGVSSDGSTVVAGAVGAAVSGHAVQGAVYAFGQGLASPSVSVSGPVNGTASTAISASSVSASLSSGASPSGSISFSVFGPQSSPPTDCSTGGTTVGTATVSDNGTYNPSAGFTPPSPGDYWWYASYVGDSNNTGASSACGAGMSETVVGAASPSVSLTAPPSGTAGSTITASSISADLSGGSNPSGSITFSVFGPQSSPPADCSTGGTTVGTGVSVAGNGTYNPSSGFTPPSAGDYWWYASYAGDSNNIGASSACGAGMSETVVGAASPSVSQSAPPSGTAGSAIAASSISADLSGGSNPSGSITFKVFGPQDSAPSGCSTGGTTVGTASVSGNGTYHPSAGFTPSSAGDYWWFASYGGDSDNDPAASACGASMAETVAVAGARPGPPAISIGSPIDGQTVMYRQVVLAGFSCQDAAGAPGIAACAGTVANGSPIDTSTLGSHAFTVGAQSKDGQTATKTVHYTVALPSNRFRILHVKAHASAEVTFDLELPGPGAVDVFESAWKHDVPWKHGRAFPASVIEPTPPHRFTFAREHLDAAGAGTIHVTVHPNSRGSGLVNHHRAVWIRLWVSYTPTGGVQRNQFGGFLHLTHS